ERIQGPFEVTELAERSVARGLERQTFPLERLDLRRKMKRELILDVTPDLRGRARREAKTTPKTSKAMHLHFTSFIATRAPVRRLRGTRCSPEARAMYEHEGPDRRTQVSGSGTLPS